MGRGIGAGIVTDGAYVGGRDHMAGEFGHITIDPAATDRCNCHKAGCLEAIASSSPIVRHYKQLCGLTASNDGIRLSDIFETHGMVNRVRSLSSIGPARLWP
jgi:glucokinase